MRDILFRAKRKDNGEWVEGLPIKTYDTEIGKNSVDYANPVPVVLMASGRIVLECGYDEVPFFNTDEYPIVNPETVEQYTGMTDKNGNKVFEGDILKGLYANGNAEVEMINGSWVGYAGKGWTDIGYVVDRVEVIGNIHDNPELLK